MKKQELLKQIYEEYSGRMLTLCVRYMGSRDLAHDMMQDGFLQVYNSLDKFQDRGDGSRRAWIERIMINTCLQHFRKKDMLRGSIDISTVQIEEMSFDEDVSRIPEKVLMDFIATLPLGYRTVFNMYVFEDLSHRDIAMALGINEKSSSSQLYRAKSLLANKIKEYERGKR